MTDLLTTDTYDSGEIVRLRPDVAETIRMDLGQTTRNLAPWDAELPPAFRRGEVDETSEMPLYNPAGLINGALDETVIVTAEPVTYTPKPTGPAAPRPSVPPKPKGWLRRLVYVGQHRTDRSHRWSVR